MCSCSAYWHVRRAKKIDPTIFEIVETVKSDTVKIEVSKVDTVFSQVRDTVIQYVQKDRSGNEVKIKYLFNTKTDSVYIQADCPDQEVITNTKTETITINPTIWVKLKYSLISLVVFALVWLFRKK